MPYLPAAATPAQLDQFAKRLAYHLSPSQSRSGLMPVQEAFARAGGYPDSHAAQASAKASRYFFNSLQAIGQTPAPSKSMPVLMGVKAYKLMEWAKHAWKKQRAILSKPHFGYEDAQAILADAWSHPNWEVVLTYAAEQKHPWAIGAQARALKIAPSLEELAELCSWQAGTGAGKRNFVGLHTVLGSTSTGDMVGLDMRQALRHVMALDDDDKRRWATASRWLAHRVRAGDRVFLMDRSPTRAGVHMMTEEARLSGRTAPVVVDMTAPMMTLPSFVHANAVMPSETAPMRFPHGFMHASAGSLTELLLMVLMDGMAPLPADELTAVVEWVGYVCVTAMQTR